MHRGTIGILTGGGDVPGLNPAIRAITIRALREGYRVMGIRRGWGGLVDLVPDDEADNRDSVQELSETIVNRAGRTGGTFLHTSRTRPSNLPWAAVPGHLRDELADEVNDATRAVRINVVNQRLGYLVRSGDPDALDSIVPMAFGNLALDLVLAGRSGRLVSVRNGVSGRKALQPRRRRSPCQRAVRRPILHEI